MKILLTFKTPDLDLQLLEHERDALPLISKYLLYGEILTVEFDINEEDNTVTATVKEVN